MVSYKPKACEQCGTEFTSRQPGESINPDLKSPDPMSLTVEHKVPIARGGRHDIDNIDFAHRVCNSSKGARTTEEYMERRKLAS